VLISFDAGGVVAIADGPEILVYQAGDGSPLWKQFCDGVLVGVAVVGPRVVTLDSEGNLTFWRLQDGQSEDSGTMSPGATQLLVSPEGAVGAVTPDGLDVFRGAGVSMPQVSAAAFGPESKSVGIGTHTGVFSVVDPQSGAAWGSVDLGAPVTGVAWSSAGQWVVSSGQRIAVIQGDGTALVVSIDAPGELGPVACSANGLLVAALCGPSQVACFELHGHRPIGTIDLKREIEGVDFGSAAMLAIGVDDGDVSLVDLYTSKVGRTEPHPGRGRNTWAVQVQVDRAAVRGAAALSKAGGIPIAEFVPIPDDDEGGCLRSCLMGLAFCTVLCMGCSGCSALVYGLRALGIF
jgi:hypothetical protein